MNILLATSNPHKIDEISAMLQPTGIKIYSLRNLTIDIPEPIEDGQTFEANASLKARYYADVSNVMCLADDSGLEVDALGGAPGVRSARYAGVDGTREEADLANNRKLLSQLGNTPIEKRTARFVCAMALCRPGEDKPDCLVRGTIEGRIILPSEAADPEHPERGRGKFGFGYDPLFVIPRLSKTTAELEPAQKNAISHRGAAARKMVERLIAVR